MAAAALSSQPLSQAEVFQTMRAATASLSSLFEELHRQTLQIADEGSPEIALELSNLFNKMNEQDELHREGVAEIQAIVEDCIESSLFDQLKILGRFTFPDKRHSVDKSVAQKEVDDSIDKLVDEQVAFCLQDLIPDRIQEELEEQTRQLEEVRVELQNSESRRKNATAQWKGAEDHLEPIHLPDGTVSKNFPDTLQELFGLNGERCKSLMEEYDMTDISDSSDYNLTSVNFFSGSPLNRLSWLRTSHVFLNAIARAPATRWVLFNSGQPLIARRPTGTPKISLAYLSTNDVQPFLGSAPFFGQAQLEGDLVVESGDSHSPTMAVRHRNPRVVFLGLHEPSDSNSQALPSSEFSDPTAAADNVNGTAYFSLDIEDLSLPTSRIDEILASTTLSRDGANLSWSEPRSIMTTLDRLSGGIFASARSLVDWNQRNKFCPACGSPTYSMWGGWKIACTSLLPWVDNGDRKPCPSAKGLHNYTHPRTDAVVIMIAIDETGDKVLLGRGKKFPGKFYSALAGFIEPGETFEDAVAREMWEEAGVTVWDVRYHSGQPWPYPANLMVGFYARADSSQPIRVDLDNELVDARWYTREEIKAVLAHPQGGLGRTDYKKLAAYDEGKVDSTQTEETAKPVIEEPPFRLPPATAIAGVLIRDWVDGKIGFTDKTTQRGNL